MYYFKLHPSQWTYEGDEKTVFRAIEMADGRYLVSFRYDNNKIVELIYDGSEIMQEFAEGNWIITNEKGELVI